MSNILRNLNALADAGYGDCSLKEVISRLSSTRTVRYVSPLTVEESGRNEYGDWEGSIPVSSAEAVSYGAEINAAVLKSMLGKEEARGLAVWLNDDGLAPKVWSIRPGTTILDHKLVGLTTVELLDGLTEDEETRLREYISGQYSDGWGEGFEQREIRVHGGAELYVSFWSYDKGWELAQIEGGAE